MDWTTVRLKVNHSRGKTGDVLEFPAEQAQELVREGKAKLSKSTKARRDSSVKIKAPRSC